MYMIKNTTVGNVQFMQKYNRLKVLNLIRARSVISRPEIIRETGLSPSSVTNVISHFIEVNLVKELGPVDSKEVGRKAVQIKFNADAFAIIAVELDPEQVSIAITNMDGTILKKQKLQIPSSLANQEILDLTRREIVAIISHGKDSLPIIRGIGIAVSGAVNNSDELVISSSLKWRGVSIRDYYEKAFSIPTFVENSSKTKVRYKFSESDSNPEKNVVFLDLSSGIGLVNFYKGKINQTITGEIGHTSVKKDGPLCFCGNKGCMELMCSVQNIVSEVEKLLANGKCEILKELLSKDAAPDYPAILQAEKAADKDVCRVIRKNGEYLGIGIANIVNLFNPDRIIINGDLLFRSELLAKTAVNISRERSFKDFVKNTEIETITISDDDAIRGLSLNVADNLFELDDLDFGAD